MEKPQYSRTSSWSTVSPTSDFYYRPSGEILSGSFRIVKVLPGRYEDPLECRLEEVSLKDVAIPFVALSYCWNSASADEEIFCDGRRLKITQNLFAALRNARATNNPVNLWIDQLCIDQSNIIDRNEQVSKMGAIYRAASGVVIWLGEEGIGSNDAMELRKRIARYWPSLFKDPKELVDPARTPTECPKWGQHPWPAFITLLTRPWFRRLWVIQEVACARNVLVTCGRATAFWDDFVKLVEVVEAVHHASARPNHMLGLKRTIHYIGFMQELRTITESGTKQAVKDYASEESMAPYVLTMAKDCEATDHRDKLFAFHHLVRLWNRPDYGIGIEMLYKLFAVQYLQRIAYAISEFSCDEQKLFRRQLEMLYSAGKCNQRLNIPSWVPDWSVPWQARPLWLGSNCYSAGGHDVKEINPIADVSTQEKPTFQLPLSVKLVDSVLSAGNRSLALGGNNPQALPDAIRAWIFEALGLQHRRRNSLSPYKDNHEAMAQTIAAGQDMDGAKISIADAVRNYDDLLNFLSEADEETRRGSRPKIELERLLYSAASFLRGRVFFITEQGRFGLAQIGVAPGDQIAIIQGAPVPVLLRNQDETWHLRCEGFVLGIMDGEAWEDKDIETQEIILA